MAEASKSERVLDLALAIADVSEFLLRADAAWFWAGWELSVVMEGELVVGADELFEVKSLGNSWSLNLPGGKRQSRRLRWMSGC